MGIKVTGRGKWKKTTEFLKDSTRKMERLDLDKYGEQGVLSLRALTPEDTGLTASGWYYTIERSDGTAYLRFCNPRINHNISIAIILDRGHGTRHGGWVPGSGFIAAAIDPIYEQIKSALK